MNIPLTPVRFLRYAQQQFPETTAIVCKDLRLNYAQFAERASRLAGALRAAGVKPGERVAFMSLNCHRLLEAYYGVLEAGAILLPLNIRLSPPEQAYILNDSGATILFVQTEFLEVVKSFRENVPSLKKIILLEGEPKQEWLERENYDAMLAAAEPYQPDVMGFDENAVGEIFYTSGTSANPKGVMLSHRNVYLNAMNSCLSFNPAINMSHLHAIPLFHANGWGAAHFVTVLGGKHVMLERFDAAELLRLVEKERITGTGFVPIMALAVIHSPALGKYDVSSLDRISIGGAASSPTLVRELEQKLGCLCFSGYGLTETSPTLSTSVMKPGSVWEGDQKFIGQAMTGYAIPGVEMRVVDANHQDVPRDGKTMGEIITRSDGVMAGYWNQPEATAEAMRGGWFHTGDMATINEHGYLLVVDRKKDIIVSGGENVSSLEVEKTLAAHPAIYEVAVLPVPDAKWGEVPKALVVLKPGAKATEAEILDFCRANLAHYKAPRSVEFFESLPKTGTGKVLKKELRKKYWGGQNTIRPESVGND